MIISRELQMVMDGDVAVCFCCVFPLVRWCVFVLARIVCEFASHDVEACCGVCFLYILENRSMDCIAMFLSSTPHTACIPVGTDVGVKVS